MQLQEQNGSCRETAACSLKHPSIPVMQCSVSSLPVFEIISMDTVSHDIEHIGGDTQYYYIIPLL